MKGQLRLTGGRKLNSPSGLNARPTTALVRESVMNLLANKVQGSFWLDICSGSGAMACEAMQKGAAKVLCIEQDPKTAEICESNLILTSQSLTEKTYFKVIRQNAIFWINKASKSKAITNDMVDIVYLDPPYKSSNLYAQILEALLNQSFLKPDSIVICEFSSRLAIEVPFGWKELDRRSYGKSSLLLIKPL